MKQHWSKSCTKIRQIFRQNIAKIANPPPAKQKIAKFGGKTAHLATLLLCDVRFSTMEK